MPFQRSDDVFSEKVTDAMELLFDDESVYEIRPTEVITACMEPSKRSEREEFGGKKNIEVIITIGPSLIPHAGTGAIANEDIPEGYCAKYIGQWISAEKDSSCDVSGYRWTVFKWDPTTGELMEPRQTAGFVDGLKEAESSWPRFVNCSSSEGSANMIQWQEFNQVYYGTKTPIKAGQELLVWYGAAFARVLGIPV